MEGLLLNETDRGQATVKKGSVTNENHLSPTPMLYYKCKRVMNKEVHDALTRTHRSSRDSLAYHSKRRYSDGLLLYRNRLQLLASIQKQTTTIF